MVLFEEMASPHPLAYSSSVSGTARITYNVVFLCRSLYQVSRKIVASKEFASYFPFFTEVFGLSPKQNRETMEAKSLSADGSVGFDRSIDRVKTRTAISSKSIFLSFEKFFRIFPIGKTVLARR